MDPITAAAAFNAAGSILGGAGGAPAAPTLSESYGSTVSVGGLNVPAFPNFPSNMYNATTGQTITAGAGSSNTLLIAGAIVVAAVLFKRFK